MKPRTAIAAGAAAVAVAGGIYLAVSALVSREEGGQREIVLRPDDQSLVRAGEALYGSHCASCHGARLEGQPGWRTRRADGRLPAPPHDESGHTWHHPDAMLFALTKLGPAAIAGGGYRSDMPAYAGVLSDEEILAVLSYIKSRWPPEIRRRHDRIGARSRAAKRKGAS